MEQLEEKNKINPDTDEIQVTPENDTSDVSEKSDSSFSMSIDDWDAFGVTVKFEKCETEQTPEDDDESSEPHVTIAAGNRSKLSRMENNAKRDIYNSRLNTKKHSLSSLKNRLERRVGNVEKILEERVEKLLGETAEKNPWFQPIVDRCKNRGTTIAALKNSKQCGEIYEIESESNGRKSSIDIEMTDGEVNILNSTGLEPIENNLSSLTTTREPSEEKHEIKNACHDLLDKLRGGFKEKAEDVARYLQRTNRLVDANWRLKSQIWSSVVTIVLVEAKNLLPMDIDGLSNPYVKFRLGTEKYKSKVVNKTLNPVWLEQFDLHLYEDPYLGQELEVIVWDRDKVHQDDIMGKTTIDLAGLERETTHRIWRDLEDGSGSIFLLLTISGTTASETISDLAAHEETPLEHERMLIKYSVRNTLERPRDVGHLTIKVYRAQGLAAADLGGKSDPFCVLELVNSRLQTQTEYKTLAPNWQKIFTFNVKDINSVLEVTVYDEDRDHKVEFLGKVAIPLLKIRNGEKRWYALKDKKLRCRAKGNGPQILLEMTVIWNAFRACIRTINPKEKKYMEPELKFKPQIFLKNVLRLKAIIMYFIQPGKYIQSCWEWESKARSCIAFVLFVLGCHYFEPYMLPAVALLMMLKYCLVSILTSTPSHSSSFNTAVNLQDSDFNWEDGPPSPGDDDDDKEEKKSLKERLQAIQEVTQTVQNLIGSIASFCERVKNLFNFTVPYLSYLAMILVFLGVVVLYLIPIRYIILAWGVNKFLRKLLRPHSVPNNEALDLISRVPDDEDLLSYRELKPIPTADCGGAGSSGSPSGNATTRREQRKRQKAA